MRSPQSLFPIEDDVKAAVLAYFGDKLEERGRKLAEALRDRNEVVLPPTKRTQDLVGSRLQALLLGHVPVHDVGTGEESNVPSERYSIGIQRDERGNTNDVGQGHRAGESPSFGDAVVHLDQQPGHHPRTPADAQDDRYGREYSSGRGSEHDHRHRRYQDPAHDELQGPEIPGEASIGHGPMVTPAGNDGGLAA